MQQQIKALYNEANTLYTQAKGIMDQAKDGKLTAEQQQQVDTLLDQVDAKKTEATRLERLHGMADTFETPDTQLPLGSGKSGGNGAAPSVALSPQVKALAGMGGYDGAQLKVAPITLEEHAQYDADRFVKHQIAAAMLWKYGLKGIDAAIARLPKELASLGAELKDLATAPGAAGGFAVADTMRMGLVAILDDLVAMRRIANVQPPIPGGSSITPSEENDLSDAEWTHEVGTGSNDTVKPFGQRTLTPHPLAKRIKVSRTLLRAATLLNVESHVLSRLARKFAYGEENAYINGTGSQQPLGLLTPAGISSTSTAASLTLGGDDIINWAYQLDAKYQRNARILCNQSFVRKVRLLRDASGGAGTGQYLWQPGLQQGKPNMILDFPYELSDYYPTGLTADAFTANALVATIGDFSYYWIQDSLSFEVQRIEELYAETNQVGFIGRKETDGMPVKDEAFRHLKIKA